MATGFCTGEDAGRVHGRSDEIVVQIKNRASVVVKGVETGSHGDILRGRIGRTEC